MPDNKVNGFEIITPLGAKVYWERFKYARNYWFCHNFDRFMTNEEVDMNLDLMKSFDCQVIVHLEDNRKRKDTIVIPPNCVTIECGVMVRHGTPIAYWQRTEFITQSISGSWWRDIMKSGENNTVMRTHESMTVESLMQKLNQRKKYGEEIRFYDGKGTRIYG